MIWMLSATATWTVYMSVSCSGGVYSRCNDALRMGLVPRPGQRAGSATSHSSNCAAHCACIPRCIQADACCAVCVIWHTVKICSVSLPRFCGRCHWAFLARPSFLLSASRMAVQHFVLCAGSQSCVLCFENSDVAHRGMVAVTVETWLLLCTNPMHSWVNRPKK